MQAFFMIKGAEDNQTILNLKKGLEKHLGKKQVDLKLSKPQPGQMGVNMINVVSAVFEKENVSKIKSFISRFLRQNKVNMVLVNARGERLELTANMDKQTLYALLNGFFERTLIIPQTFEANESINTQSNQTKTRKKIINKSPQPLPPVKPGKSRQTAENNRTNRKKRQTRTKKN